jgi:NAD(P)-dependent dehydrogenase (short-subunit alcohol dehydrogenase family)
MAHWLITGISGGLGLSLAKAALARGDMVTGTTRNASSAHAFEALAPGRSRAMLLDLTDEAAIASAVEGLGRIDILVNNAGYGLTGAIEETSRQDVDDLFAINVLAPLAMIRAVLPAMRARRAGHIVNITSVSGHAAWSGTGLYGASKFALECIGRTLAQEVQHLGIGVTNVAPGGLRTQFAGAGLASASGHIADYAPSAHLAAQVLASYQGREPGDPDKAAQAILTALDSDHPPLTLLLGADALSYAEQEQASLTREREAWRALSLSIAASP